MFGNQIRRPSFAAMDGFQRPGSGDFIVSETPISAITTAAPASAIAAAICPPVLIVSYMRDELGIFHGEWQFGI
jgi:hypothetical protein